MHDIGLIRKKHSVFRYFIIVLLIGINLYLFVIKNKLIDREIISDSETYNQTSAFTLLENNDHNDLLYLSRRAESNATSFYYLDSEDLALTQKEFAGVYQPYGTIFYNSDFRNVSYTVLIDDEHNYSLFETHDNKKSIRTEVKHIKNYNLAKITTDSLLTIKETVFQKYSVNEKISYEDRCRIIKEDNTHRLVFNPAIYDSLVLDCLKLELDSLNIRFYNDIAENLSQLTGRKFTYEDIYRIIQYFRRRHFYMKKFDQYKFDQLMYSWVNIFGELDVNEDGKADLLLLIRNDRWLPDQFIAYDVENAEIIWEKDFITEIKELQIIDIDNDGEQDILLSTHSPCYEMPIDKLSKDYIDDSMHCFFTILEKDGSFKKIYNEKVMVRNDLIGFYHYKFLPLPQEKRVVLGLWSKNQYIKKLQYLDLTTNSVISTDIDYNILLHLFAVDDNIVCMNKNSEKLQKLTLSKDLQLENTISRSANHRYRYYQEDALSMDNKNYDMIWFPLQVIDDKLNIIYSISEEINYEDIETQGNSIYYINDNTGYLKKVTLTSNFRINPFYLLLLLFELLVILIYYYFRQILFLPFVSGESSYAVLYNFFGLFYFWRIYGKLSFYRFPRNISRSQQKFFYLLKDLTTDFKEIYQKKLPVMQIRLFRLNTQNELFLVQRIAHDIKNQLHLVNLQLADQEMDEKDRAKQKTAEKLIEQIRPTMKGIYKKTLLLSGFSRLFELNIKRKDLIMLLENLIMEYANHPQFSRIFFEPERESFYVDIDENLFQIAIRNLLNNAMKYSEPDSEIEIELDVHKNTYQISISNPGKISENILSKIQSGLFSESSGGSGVGIQITRKIIENFNGELAIESKDGIVEVIMRIPKKLE